MGILDIFRSKQVPYKKTNTRIRAMHGHVQEAFSTVHNNVTALHSAFATLHADIAKQKEWLAYLHQHQLTLRDKHGTHKDSTKSELSKLNSWISFLHKGQQKQEKHLKTLQKSLERTMLAYDAHLQELVKALENTHSVALEAHKKEPKIVREEAQIDHDALVRHVQGELDYDISGLRSSVSQEVQAALEATLEARHEEQKQALREVLQEIKENLTALEEQKEALREMQEAQAVREEATVVHAPAEIVIPPAMPLTNPEQKLLNLLINEADPLSYAKIGQLTGHSINTVRVNMNSLKKKGLIEESTLPTGVKLFSVTSREKVRTMYNLQVL